MAVYVRKLWNPVPCVIDAGVSIKFSLNRTYLYVLNADGKEVAFDLRKGPPSGHTPLFSPPEVLDNVQNVVGVTPSLATSATESNGQVGNLQLSAQQEEDLVNFLKILTDGYTKPNPVSP